MRRVWLLLACAIASGHAIPGAAAPPAPPTKWLAQDSSGQATAISNGNFGSGDFSLSWTIFQDSTIRFTVSKNTTGYIAFGLADSPGVMGPADAYAAWVDSSGNAQVMDFSTISQGAINPPDAIQNAANVSGSFANGALSVSFTRALNTNDTQDKPITPGPMNLIWSWSNTKPSGTTLTPHNFADHGVARVVFISAPADPSPSPAPSSSSLCSGKFCLAWSLGATTIGFTMTIQASGYIAIGLSDIPGAMGPADAYAGWVDGSGNARVMDFSTISQGAINPPDAVQNVANVSGSFANGTLSITFYRALNTNDTQDRTIVPGTMNLIWSWSNTKPTGTTLTPHNFGDTGSAEVNFFAGSAGSPAPATPSPSPKTAVAVSPVQTSFCSGPFCLAWFLGQTTIGFKMTIQARGYVAIGFSNTAGVMGPADAYAGYVDNTGNAFVVDFSTTGSHTVNDPDTIQNVANVSGSYANGVLSVTFYRALNTNDPQDKIINPEAMNLVWSWSNTVPTTTTTARRRTTFTLPQHASSDVGSAQVNFFSGGVSFSNDLQLWIPVTSVASFVAVLLLPGLLGKMFGIGFGSRLDSVLSFRPFPPRGRHWFDTLTLDLFYTVQDMQVGDFLIVALWFPAVLLMLLSPQGNGLGRVCAAAFGTLLLPVTRYSVWAALLGSSFERYIKFHRWAARCTLVIIMSHLIVQCLDKGSTVLTATANDSTYGYVYGLVSFVLMGSMSLFAVEPIRRRFFELFYYTHFLAFPAIALAMMHSYAVCYAMIPSLAMYLIDKAIRFWSTMHKYKILQATPLAGAVRLTVERPRQKLLRCAPGQYYFVTVPAVSHLQSHPFTVAAITEADDLTFLIRSMGPGTFTNQVCDLASSSSPSYVRLSGPHGSLSLPKPLLDYRVVYLVAGGVGVTPMMCIAQALLQAAPSETKVVFIWISCHTSAFNEWFPDMLIQMMTSKGFDIRLHGTGDPQEKQRGASVELMVRTDRSDQYDDSPFPPPPSPEPSVANDVEVAQFRPPIAVGRPDWDATFGPHAADGADVAVLTCGPAPLMTDVQRVAHAHRFHFHKETFAL